MQNQQVILQILTETQRKNHLYIYVSESQSAVQLNTSNTVLDMQHINKLQ